jgi:hypothetical protein
VAASIFIIVVSVFLFVYWFRYTCVLILSEKNTKDYAQQIAIANQLTFLEARNRLSLDDGIPQSSNVAATLDSLHRSLDRDYRLLTYLLQHAENYYPGGQSLEQHLLRLDYQIMRWGYWLLRGLSKPLACATLRERASILSHFANEMGERVARV